MALWYGGSLTAATPYHGCSKTAGCRGVRDLAKLRITQTISYAYS